MDYIRKRDEIEKVRKDLISRTDSIPPLKETDDSDDSDFYGHCGDFEQNAGLGQLGIQGEIKFKGGELGMYNEDTQEWGEAQMRCGNRKGHFGEK